jgi:predicted anti-sigma-YlaC factor YlaD
MTCQEALPFISPLYDGEQVPADVTKHVQSCPQCRQCLKDYAEIDAECRLLASAARTEEDLPGWLPRSDRSRGSVFFRFWTAHVLVPQVALIVGIVAILGLVVKVTWKQDQAHPQRNFFQFELSASDAPKTTFAAGMSVGRAEMPYELTGPHGSVLALLNILDVQADLVRVSVRAERFENQVRLDCKPGEAPEFKKCTDETKRVLASTQEREYQYRPGQTLEVPVQGGGSLLLTGRVSATPQPFSWQNAPVESATEEVAVSTPPLAPEKHVVFRPARIVNASPENPCVTFYRPDWGLFVFALHPFPGSAEATVNNGRLLFELEGKWYYVSAASGIAGTTKGMIYYKLIRGYEPSRGLDTHPFDRLEGATREFLPSCSAEEHLF